MINKKIRKALALIKEAERKEPNSDLRQAVNILLAWLYCPTCEGAGQLQEKPSLKFYPCPTCKGVK